jgi:hypothetical protein
MRDENVDGTAKVTITSASAKGEASRSSTTSHPRVIICMFIARNDINDPAQSHLKSRYWSDSNMVYRVGEDSGGFFSGVGAEDVGGVSVRWSKSVLTRIKNTEIKYRSTMAKVTLMTPIGQVVWWLYDFWNTPTFSIIRVARSTFVRRP